MKHEGWHDDISTPRNIKTHYYRDGVALCGKTVVKHYFNNFEQRNGSKYFGDCSICIKKSPKIEYHNPIIRLSGRYLVYLQCN